MFIESDSPLEVYQLDFAVTPGWTWSNGEPMSVSHAHVKNSINNHDGAMNPCSHNFCGVLNVVSTVDLELFDNCCNNIPRSFVCSTESLK